MTDLQKILNATMREFVRSYVERRSQLYPCAMCKKPTSGWTLYCGICGRCAFGHPEPEPDAVVEGKP